MKNDLADSIVAGAGIWGCTLARRLKLKARDLWGLLGENTVWLRKFAYSKLHKWH